MALGNDEEINNDTKTSLLHELCINKWKGKKWAVIGDSITEHADDRSTKNYNEYIEDYLGMTSINYGIGGTGYRVSYLGAPPIYKRLDTFDTSCDLITVFAGTNDWDENDEIEFILGELGDTDPTATFYGAIDYVLSGLISRFPTKRIAAFTPLPREKHWNEVSTQNTYNLLDVADAIKNVCAKYSIPCLDLTRNSNFYSKNSTFREIYQPDGLHPNENGHKLVAEKILAFLNTL